MIVLWGFLWTTREAPCSRTQLNALENAFIYLLYSSATVNTVSPSWKVLTHVYIHNNMSISKCSFDISSAWNATTGWKVFGDTSEVELMLLANVKPPWVKQRELSAGLLFGTCKCPIYLGYPCHFASKLQPWNWVFNRSLVEFRLTLRTCQEHLRLQLDGGLQQMGWGQTSREKRVLMPLPIFQEILSPQKNQEKIPKPLSNSNNSTFPIADHLTQLFSAVLPCGLLLVPFPPFLCISAVGLSGFRCPPGWDP